MKASHELTSGIAGLLKALREKHGISKAKMADLLYLDPHTWAKYETGESAPTVPEFLEIFNKLGDNPLRAILDYLYPDIYAGLTPESDIEDLRKAAAHYMMYVATNHFVREFDYLVFGKTGANAGARFDEYTMMAHLSLRDNVILATLIDKLYAVSEARDELILTEHVMPDVENFRAGYQKAALAVKEGKSGYTTAIE